MIAFLFSDSAAPLTLSYYIVRLLSKTNSFSAPNYSNPQFDILALGLFPLSSPYHAVGEAVHAYPHSFFRCQFVEYTSLKCPLSIPNFGHLAGNYCNSLFFNALATHCGP